MEKVVLELYFKNICLGKIQCSSSDFPWNYGIFIPYSETNSFRSFFDYFLSGKEDIVNLFPSEFFQNGNWYVLFPDKTEKLLIQIPWVHSDNNIGWGWL